MSREFECKVVNCECDCELRKEKNRVVAGVRVGRDVYQELDLVAAGAGERDGPDLVGLAGGHVKVGLVAGGARRLPRVDECLKKQEGNRESTEIRNLPVAHAASIRTLNPVAAAGSATA